MVARGHGWPLAQYLLWITEEDRYLEVQHPDEAADVVLNSGGFASVEDAIAAAQTLA